MLEDRAPEPLLRKYYTAQYLCAKDNTGPKSATTRHFRLCLLRNTGGLRGVDVVYWANQQLVATVIRRSAPKKGETSWNR